MPSELPNISDAVLVEMFDTIDSGIREAIAIVEMIEHPLFDGDYLTRFDNTYSSRGVEFIGTVLHKAGVVLIGRLWDKDPDAYSIPRLYELTNSDEALAAVINRRRRALLQIVDDMRGPVGEHDESVTAAVAKNAAADAERAERQTRAQFKELRSLFTDATEAKRRESLVNLRHKISHAIKSTSVERAAAKAGRVVPNVKWNDLRPAVEHSAKIAVLLASVSQDLVSNCDDKSPWQTYAWQFWNSIKDPK